MRFCADAAVVCRNKRAGDVTEWLALQQRTTDLRERLDLHGFTAEEAIDILSSVLAVQGVMMRMIIATTMMICICYV